MSEAEVARDLPAVLARVREGVEVFIEQDHKPVAVLRPSASARPGCKLSECIAMATAYEAKVGNAPMPDEDFAQDVQAGIDAATGSSRPPGISVWDCPRLQGAHRRRAREAPGEPASRFAFRRTRDRHGRSADRITALHYGYAIGLGTSATSR